MTVDRDEFFAKLDGMTVKEIQERLPTWDIERLALAQEYVGVRLAPATEAQPDQQEPVEVDKMVASLAIQVAKAANTKATAALILSVGAMLAAVLCGVVIALRY